jgi:hypothetical protein
MTSTGSRRATRLVPVLFCLLLAVLGGRQLSGTEAQAVASPLKSATLSVAADDGLLAVASRAPVPAQEARLDIGPATAIGATAVLILAWMAALTVARGRLVLDVLGVCCRRRGPPSVLVI